MLSGQFHARILRLEALPSAIHGRSDRYLFDDLEVGAILSTNAGDHATEFFRLPIFATRSVLMSTEILKSKEQYDQAVQQFLKLSQEVRSSSPQWTTLHLVSGLRFA